MDELSHLTNLLSGRKVAVLTGAGVSTESGIPDYRGPETRRRSRNPIQFREFLRKPEGRQRYWARAVIGWRKFNGRAPNPAHEALRQMERAGVISGVITQNVDRLHHRAGSQEVVELHGALAEVRCLDCERITERTALQERLLHLNPGWDQQVAEIAPDGDAELPAELTRDFQVAACEFCGGVLKPNVVFFGESVPKPVLTRALDMFESSDALLVAGSSLAVFSGLRFVRKAVKRDIPVGLVNLGPTERGYECVDVHVDGRASEVLTALNERLSGATAFS